jgi:UDP-GlcNAc:undecaprenyl-phosphate GlcNAc-1-phosphate transferase
MIASGDEASKILIAVMFSAAGVGLIGFADDQREVSPLSRILLLVIFCAISFSLDPQLISGVLHWGSFQSVSIPFYWYWPLMAVTFVGLVNAVNMADGQNGIVGSIYTVWLICLLLSTSGIARDIAMVLLACSIVFLAFNLRGYLFLGDAGTYGVTFVIGLLVTQAHAQGQLTLETIIVWFYVPVLDCLRLLITRPLRRRSPLDGDRDHFHHRLQDRFGKDMGLAIYVGLVATTSLASTLAPRFALVCLVVLTAVYFSFARLTGSVTAQSVEEVDEEGRKVQKPAMNIIVMNESVEKKSKHISS